MGKKGGAYNLLESYLASGLATQSTNNNMGYIPLPDSMRTSTLLEQIGVDRSWSEDQIQHDIEIMENNRLYYVRDLRELSKNSWKKIELLPLVKDLLKKELSPKEMKKKEKKKKEKKLQKLKYKNLGTPVTEDVITNTLSNMNITSSDNNKKSVAFDTPNDNKEECSSSSSSSSSDSDCENKNVTTAMTMTDNNKKVFTGRPIKAISGNRIRVRTSDGDVFEADRYCPHKKVDLLSYGQVLGRTLICTKHNWKFPLDGSGLAKRGRDVNACKVNDW